MLILGALEPCSKADGWLLILGFWLGVLLGPLLTLGAKLWAIDGCELRLGNRLGVVAPCAPEG